MVRVETTLAVSWRVTYFAALICTAAGVHVRKAQRMLFFIAGGDDILGEICRYRLWIKR